jgi:nucleoid-associated protein YejK
MQKRATQIHEFADKLIIRVADPNDILIMKSVTSRDKDLDDIVAIVNKSRINWEVIVEEAKEQVKLGNEIAIMGLGEKLEKLTNQKVITVPKEISDELWKLFTKQVKDKAGKSK